MGVLQDVQVSDKIGMYAFWRYDLYPYMLGGEITKDFAPLCYEVRGYEGLGVHPIAIVSKEDGEKLNHTLKTLAQEYRREQKELHDRYMELLNHLKKW